MAKSRLLKRSYLRPYELVSGTEKFLGAFILVVVVGIVATFAYQATTNDDHLFTVDPAAYDVPDKPQNSTADPSYPAQAAPTPETTVAFSTPAASASTVADNPFPDPGLPGWRLPARVFRFTPDNLYVKINGRADIYLQFQVVSLTFGTYAHESDRTRTIDIYWYDMGEPANALGIYRAEAPPDAAPVSIGREGYAVGGAVFYRKGAAYVQVLPMSLDESVKDASLEIAKGIAEQIRDEEDDAWALKVLPTSGRVADSFAYLAEDAFSLDFLSDVYTARYDVSGERLTLFIHRAADAASAEVLFDRYAGFFKDYGQVTWRDPDPARRIVAGEVAGVVDVIFAKGRYLGGVAGADQVETAREAAVSFHDELTASEASGKPE